MSPEESGEDTTIAHMDTVTAATLAALLRGQRIAALGTLRQGAPLVSMVLYLPADDFSAFHLHVSRLAWHTQDMIADSRVSLSVAATDDGTRNPQTLERVSLRGEATPLANGAPGFEKLKAAWLARTSAIGGKASQNCRRAKSPNAALAAPSSTSSWCPR